MKTALITGANKGIGFETARYLLKKGLFVYIGSRDIKKGEAAVKELNNDGFKNVKTVALDVTDVKTLLAAKVIIEREKGQLDVLINNAGIFGGMQQKATDVSVETFKKVFETNVFGVASVTQTFMDLLKKSAEPRIVNVTSSVGSLTMQSDPEWVIYDDVKWAAYASSKAALNMYTINLAYELRDTAFKVNAVCPGYTKTDFTGHNGNWTVKDAAERIIKYALIDQNGPTGKFFSEETNPETGVCPW